MQVVAKRTLVQFWESHRAAETPLRTWYMAVSKAEWTGPQDIRDQFRSVNFVADNRVIFDVGGNNFRLVARVVYEYKAVQIKFVGTHAEYDKIDPVTCKVE